MFNPLSDDISLLSEVELEQKIIELGRKYWQTRNPQVQVQISIVLEIYKEEAHTRRAIEYNRQKDQENGESGLDSLINIS